MYNWFRAFHSLTFDMHSRERVLFTKWTHLNHFYGSSLKWCLEMRVRGKMWFFRDLLLLLLLLLSYSVKRTKFIPELFFRVWKETIEKLLDSSYFHLWSLNFAANLVCLNEHRTFYMEDKKQWATSSENEQIFFFCHRIANIKFCPMFF